MRNFLDGLFKLLLLIGCLAFLYQYHFKPPSQPKRANVRYSEDNQEPVFADTEENNDGLDDCQRHLDNAVRQACIEAKSK